MEKANFSAQNMYLNFDIQMNFISRQKYWQVINGKSEAGRVAEILKFKILIEMQNLLNVGEVGIFF